MMKIRIISLIGFFWLLIYSSCFYRVEEELYKGFVCNTENINYSDSINRILQIHECLDCHNDLDPQGGVFLDTYDQLIIHVNNGALMGAINHETDYEPMPENEPKIPQCDIDKIQAWIDAGAPEN